MYQNQLHKEQSHRLKWGLLISGLLLILLVLIIGYLYVSVMQEKTSGYSQAEKRALDETTITEIDEVQRYHGEEAYHVVSGFDEKDHPLFAFVPFDNEHEIITVEQPDTYTKDRIEREWKEQCSTCLLTSITPALIEDTAVWEINFRTNKDTYLYEYISMKDGSLFEQLRFKKLFN